MDYLDEIENEVQTYFSTHHIPTYFYQCFFGELVKVWGASIIVPDKNYRAEYDDDFNIIEESWDDYSYKDQIDYCLAMAGGTGGWFIAFKEACTQCDLMDMYEHYAGLDWRHSDIFDGIIVDNMVNILFDNNVCHDYYKFRFQKEKNNEIN